MNLNRILISPILKPHNTVVKLFITDNLIRNYGLKTMSGEPKHIFALTFNLNSNITKSNET